MLDVICVCRSGGGYDASWVAKLRDGVARNIDRPHRFRCLSDIEVPCERIQLQHDWPGWWSKVELFRAGVIERPTLYLDLDTVIVSPMQLNGLLQGGPDFAMLQSFWQADMVGSGVMFFSGDNVPHHIYEKFVKQPEAYIRHYKRNASGPYVGDQAYIWDCMKHEVPRINDYLPGIKSYKMHCIKRLPEDASIVCFHGSPKLPDVDHDWIRKCWWLPTTLTESDAA